MGNISHSCLIVQFLRVIAFCNTLALALPRQFARVARSHGCGEHYLLFGCTLPGENGPAGMPCRSVRASMAFISHGPTLMSLLTTAADR